MQIRFPLYARILLWFFLNLAILCVVFYGFLRVQFHFGLDSLLTGQAGERVQAVSDVIAGELNNSARKDWDGILSRFSQGYHVQFFVFQNDGTQAAGEHLDLPTEISSKLNDRRFMQWQQREFQKRNDPNNPRQGPPQDQSDFDDGQKRGGQRENPPPPRDGPPDNRKGRPFGGGNGPARFMVHTQQPSRYWVVTRIPIIDRERMRPMPIALVMMSESIRGGGLFFDYVPWIIFGLAMVVLSVLFWFPLVRSITRSVSQITQATEEIAEGGFEARVDAERSDELGRLGQAINRMASRLAGFVMGQKRFLGDIAHELCSPIARVQIALGILELRATESQKTYVEDVREEVQHMSSLVNELLSFSKAGLRQKAIQVAPVSLSDVVKRVLDRETSESDKIEVNVPADLSAMAEPELLTRAVANLVRNALRYAGHAGPISISAAAANGRVLITVADCGPGVPEESLQQIFDPFYRVESSRSRETGGIGLGLAIVKTCIESCQGTVIAHNRQPSGLQVDVSLQACPEEKTA